MCEYTVAHVEHPQFLHLGEALLVRGLCRGAEAELEGKNRKA